MAFFPLNRAGSLSVTIAEDLCLGIIVHLAYPDTVFEEPQSEEHEEKGEGDHEEDKKTIESPE